MDKQNEKLFKIAKQLCEPERTYTKDQVWQKMLALTNQDEARAKNGLNMMVKCGALERTLDPNLFFLGGSTPF